MISKIMFLSSMMSLVHDALGSYTPSTDTYLFGFAKLFPVFSQAYLFDGPASISHAPTTPMTTKKPTLEQLMYYNYYSVSMYCPYELNDLSCFYCQKFKMDVNEHKVLTNAFHDTIAIVTVSNSRKEIVIAYRGSMNIWNIVLDLLLFNVNIPGEANQIKMHRGFYIATMSLYNEVVKAVGYQRNLHPDYRIVITGHSLGGAMARVTEYFFISLKQFPGASYEIYTYGEPRVGNKYLVDFLNLQNVSTVRIVARADIVPHVPPTSIFGTKLIGDYYIHPQTEFWINGADGQRFCNQSFYEDPTCSDSLGPIYTPVDHATYYFDADYAACYVAQPVPNFALPFYIFQPVEIIPPLPEPISDFLAGATDFIANPMSTFLGR